MSPSRCIEDTSTSKGGMQCSPIAQGGSMAKEIEETQERRTLEELLENIERLIKEVRKLQHLDETHEGH